MNRVIQLLSVSCMALFFSFSLFADTVTLDSAQMAVITDLKTSLESSLTLLEHDVCILLIAIFILIGIFLGHIFFYHFLIYALHYLDVLHVYLHLKKTNHLN